MKKYLMGKYIINKNTIVSSVCPNDRKHKITSIEREGQIGFFADIEWDTRQEPYISMHDSKRFFIEILTYIRTTIEMRICAINWRHR